MDCRGTTSTRSTDWRSNNNYADNNDKSNSSKNSGKVCCSCYNASSAVHWQMTLMMMGGRDHDAFRRKHHELLSSRRYESILPTSSLSSSSCSSPSSSLLLRDDETVCCCTWYSMVDENKPKSPSSQQQQQQEQPHAVLPKVNEHGQTELQCLLLRLPQADVSLEKVQELLTKCPHAVEMVDFYGRTPLFTALRRGWHQENGADDDNDDDREQHLKLLRLLFHAYPFAITRVDFCGDSPLDLLFYPSSSNSNNNKCDASLLFLKYVMQQHPSLSMHQSDRWSSKPLLERLCASAVVASQYPQCVPPLITLSSRPLDIQQPQQQRQARANNHPTNNNDDDDNEQENCNYYSSLVWTSWNKFVVVLRAAYRHALGQQQLSLSADQQVTELPELHLGLQLKLPAAILLHFCNLYPDQLFIPMQQQLGKEKSSVSIWTTATATTKLLPLHLVLTSRFYCQEAHSSTFPENGGGGTRGDASGGACDVVCLIRKMLQIYPQAAHERLPSCHVHDNGDSSNSSGIPRTGLWPLHAALRTGYSWSTGIAEMASLIPDLLHTQADDYIMSCNDDHYHHYYRHQMAGTNNNNNMGTLYKWQAFQVAAMSRNVGDDDDDDNNNNNNNNLNHEALPQGAGPDLDTIYQLLRQRPHV